jgi:tetratricopeptide (TPR) repeat protein
MFRRAQELEKKGQWRKAAAILREILCHYDNRDAHSHLALARLEARRTAEYSESAVNAFRNGTALCPHSIHLWQAWAVYEESHGHVEKAKELFDRALRLQPDNPYVCHAYGRMMWIRSKDERAAQTLWEQALCRTSTAALVCSLGELLVAQSKVEAAKQLYVDHVHKVATDRERTEVYLAHAWLEERSFGDFDRAHDLIQLALATSPSSSVAQIALARLEGRRRAHFQGGAGGGAGGRGEGPASGNAAMAQHLARACITVEKDNGQGATAGNSKRNVPPADGRVYNAWASIEVKATRYKEARKILRKGMKQYPMDHSLLQAAGKVEERIGNYTGARDLYGESLRVQPSAPCLVSYALLDLTHPESGTRNLSRAERLFEEALLLEPRHGPAYNAYARSVVQYSRDEDKARSIYERGVQANCPDAASIYHGYARLELSLGNVDKARDLLMRGMEEVRRLDVGKDSPHRERALFLTHTLGMLELNRNDPASALGTFVEGIRRYGNSSRLLLGAALCEVKLGNQDKARMLFEQSVLNDDRHAHAWQAWGVMEMRAGNVKTARTLFECGIKSAPRHGALWQAFATMESRLGDVDAARQLFVAGIKNAPRHIPLFQSWAFMELREQNFTVAKALIAQALTQDKRNGAGWQIAAEIEERLGNSGLANLLLRRGIECAPTKPELYRALGDSLVRKGKIIEAREVLEQGIQVDPRHAPLYHSLAELEARVFNVDGLARLHKRASSVFNTNALEPPERSSEMWGTRIRADRAWSVPEGVAALAHRIVDDEGNDAATGSIGERVVSSFLDQSSLLEGGFVGDLLVLEDERIDES